DRLASLEAPLDLEKRLEEAFDLELRDEAERRVSGRVARHRWEAYWLTAREGVPGAEVADRLGRPVAQVYVARRDVLQMVKAELRRLQGPGEVGGGGER